MSAARAILLGALGAAAVAGGGCAAPRPSPELVDARTVYARAAHGETAQVAPEDLAEAKRALDAAERSLLDQPGSDESKDLAYIAHRKLLLAEADARTTLAALSEAQALETLTNLRRERLADDENRAELSDDKATLDARPPRARQAKEALERLTPFAAVNEGTRGMAVTLAGSVLFEGDTATLMATGRERLDRVAEALRQVGGQSILVRGYVDPSGDATRDADLTRRRAEAVRDHLATRGIAAARMRAFGLGSTDPITSNASVEGKNENRRIEIVVERPRQDAGGH